MTRRVIHSGRAATCGPSALDDEENQLADWDWQVFCRDTIDGEARPSCFGAGGDITYLDWMLSAWGWTASVSLLALAVAMLFGCLMGILRTTPSRGLVLLGDAWTELFRNIPVLVQVFLWYFVVPELVPALKQIPSFLLVVLGLGFFTSARVSEQVKAGIQSLPRGQRMAGQALGLTLPQTYRHVLLLDPSQMGGAITVNDGLFYACETTIQQRAVMVSCPSAMMAGGEGLFNLSLMGQGTVALESSVPASEIVTVDLENDELKVDGNFAIAWTNGLQFTVERSTKTLIGSAASGEGLVNVYRGTGRVLLAPVAANLANPNAGSGAA